MSDVSLTLQNAAGVYLAITETPSVVTLSQAVISGALASTVTVSNVVSVSVVTMPSITVTPAAVTTVSGTVTASIEVPYIKVNINVANIDGAIVSNVFLRKIGEYTYESIRYQGNEDEAFLKVVLEVGGEQYIKIWRLYSGGFFANIDGLIAHVSPQNAGSDNGDPLPPKTGWTLETGITGTLSISYEQPSTQPISGTVTIGSLPAISGTVTANSYSGQFVRVIATGDLGGNWLLERVSETFWKNKDDANEGAEIVYVPDSFIWRFQSGEGAGAINSYTFNSIPPSDGWYGLGEIDTISVTPENPYPISGTVTIGNSVTIGSCVTHGVTIANSSVTIAGTVTANLSTVPTHAVTLVSTTVTVSSLPALAAGTAQIGSVTASISGTVPVSGTFWQATQPISGTVTVSSTTVTVSALPSGALTTRFGSVTTGGTSQLTACVTNSARKYLFCQNIHTATVTIGIGFSPTTTQGIQLTAGGGITFDAFCPTGGVWWLGATNANYTILEG